MYGEDGSCNNLECTQIGEVLLDNLPPLPQGSPIEVTYKFNENGILEVKGREPSSNKLVTSSIEHTGGLTEKEIEDAQKRTDMITVSG
jgi:molecular chaperone DnaK